MKPRHRSRTFRRIARRLPGGKTVIRHSRRKSGKPHCAHCHSQLPGVARGSAAEVRKLPKSGRRPERPYGGVLCSRCMRREIIARARST